MKLFAKWNSKDGWKAKEAIEKIKNQKKLARVAVKARSWEARITALNKLKDAERQQLLTRIATEDKDWEIRRAAVKLLVAANNWPLLKEIIAKYGKGLKSESEDDRSSYKSLLLFLYEEVNAPLKWQIASYSGTIIEYPKGEYVHCFDTYEDEFIQTAPERRFHVS
ncbi:MAG: HEAT repeat domain-containing protein [Tannerellaceae bacterium]|jgi:hypothetical protein|nr:HEAT repeat domain-containing protein [Tannerellaceae bacterium]